MKSSTNDMAVLCKLKIFIHLEYLEKKDKIKTEAHASDTDTQLSIGASTSSTTVFIRGKTN